MGFLLALVAVGGAIFFGILNEAWSQGLTLKEWLQICDEHEKRKGEELKRKYLKGKENGL